MPNNCKQQALDLLKSFETGDRKSAAHINPNNYVQHKPVDSRWSGWPRRRLSSSSKRIGEGQHVRVFEDGDYVFLHTEYNFFGPKIGFDIFRFEDGKAVEHWDNLQETPPAPKPKRPHHDRWPDAGDRPRQDRVQQSSHAGLHG